MQSQLSMLQYQFPHAAIQKASDIVAFAALYTALVAVVVLSLAAVSLPMHNLHDECIQQLKKQDVDLKQRDYLIQQLREELRR